MKHLLTISILLFVNIAFSQALGGITPKGDTQGNGGPDHISTTYNQDEKLVIIKNFASPKIIKRAILVNINSGQRPILLTKYTYRRLL